MQQECTKCIGCLFKELTSQGKFSNKKIAYVKYFSYKRNNYQRETTFFEVFAHVSLVFLQQLFLIKNNAGNRMNMLSYFSDYSFRRLEMIELELQDK